MRRRRFTAPQSAQPISANKTAYRHYALLVLAAAVIGFLAQFQWLGSVAIGAYGVYAVWRKVPSRITFTMALMALSLVPVAVIFGKWVVAQNFGAYSFLLFVVGIACLTFELRAATHKLRNMNNVKQ